MSRRFYSLPPLTSLSVFECSARHLSFKRAAQELSVTPGAVSHQIKLLEQELGASLFDRRHRGVMLTPDGQDLFETLATSFESIAKRIGRIRDADTTDKITVGSTTAISALWLSPAIVQFWHKHPDVSVDQLTQDAPFTSHANMDFMVRYGWESTKNMIHTPLYRDELVPVSSPEVASQLNGASLSDLASRWLIHNASEGRDWTTWQDWFNDLGYTGPVNKGTRVTNYSVALQLASKGTGLVLGWRHLVQSLIDSGDLAIVKGHSLPAPRSFYLVECNGEASTESAQNFKRWILSTAADFDVN